MLILGFWKLQFLFAKTRTVDVASDDKDYESIPSLSDYGSQISELSLSKVKHQRLSENNYYFCDHH